MRSVCFLDTNVLIYAAAGKRDDPHKFEIASRIVLQESFGLSGQVLAEFYVVVTRLIRGSKTSIDIAEVERWIDLLAAFPVAAVDETLVKMGIAHSQRYQVSYYDGAILAAAERLEAPILYTEDLNHGQLYGSVRVINPFKPA